MVVDDGVVVGGVPAALSVDGFGGLADPGGTGVGPGEVVSGRAWLRPLSLVGGVGLGVGGGWLLGRWVAGGLSWLVVGAVLAGVLAWWALRGVGGSLFGGVRGVVGLVGVGAAAGLVVVAAVSMFDVGSGGVLWLVGVGGVVLLVLLAGRVVGVGEVGEGVVDRFRGWFGSDSAGVVGAVVGAVVLGGSVVWLMSGPVWGVRGAFGVVAVGVGVAAVGLVTGRDPISGVGLVVAGVGLVAAGVVSGVGAGFGVWLLVAGGLVCAAGGVAKLGVGWLGSVSSLGGPLLLVAGGVVSVSSDRFLVGVGLVVAGVVLGVSELVGD